MKKQITKFVWLTSWLALGLALPAGPARAQADVCALLTRAEIKEIQGEPILEAKASARAREGFAVSQCFYAAKAAAKSVSLQWTRQASARAQGPSPRDDWKRIFHPARPAADKQAASDGQPAGKQPAPPAPVPDLGDEAFWVGDKVAGALYVLQGDSYFRLSIGGWTDAALRLEKTKTLARKAAKRL